MLGVFEVLKASEAAGRLLLWRDVLIYNLMGFSGLDEIRATKGFGRADLPSFSFCLHS